MFLSQLGCIVVCLDKDLSQIKNEQLRLSRTPFKKASAQLTLQQLDLVTDAWPYGSCTVGGIINVHFLLPLLFPFFAKSLHPAGYLLLETTPGCGRNYLDLPKAGELRVALEKTFDFEFYLEHRVGPRDCGAVTVRLLARRRADEQTAKLLV